MNIQPINNSISMQGNPNNFWNSLKRRVSQKVIDAVPQHTVKESAKKIEAWEQIDGFMSRPAENRAIMGATALLTQPAIDYHNHKVDKETRRVARNRTIAKILAGAGVGIFVVRGPIYKGILNMTNLKGNSKYSKSLIPKVFLNEIEQNPTFLKNYRSTLAMLISLGAMCITNFVLDAPLTVIFTNYLNKKTEAKDEQ